MADEHGLTRADVDLFYAWYVRVLDEVEPPGGELAAFQRRFEVEDMRSAWRDLNEELLFASGVTHAG